ncbi:hypothetical protein V8C35DRAFT_137983 [Trichoderma chlorosporum]
MFAELAWGLRRMSGGALELLPFLVMYLGNTTDATVPFTHCSLQAANALPPLRHQWSGEAFQICSKQELLLLLLIMAVPNPPANLGLRPRAVASAPDTRPGRKGTYFVDAGGGNGPGERRRKGAEPQTSFKPDDSTAQSPREGVECVS